MRKGKTYLIGPSEEVGEVLGEGEGGDAAPDLGPLLDLHRLDGDLGDGAVTGPDEEVAVGEDAHGLDAEREVLAVGGHALVDRALDVDLDHVARGRPAVDELVLGVDDAGGPLPLDVAQVDVQGLDLGYSHTSWGDVPFCSSDRWSTAGCPCP